MARRSKENAIDWDAIERQYRIGQKSNTQLAEEFGVQSSSIGRRAKSHGWVQDKRKDVVAATNSLLIQNASGNCNPNATPSASEIKVAAQAAADLILQHRKSISREERVTEALLAHVESAIENMSHLGEILEFVRESSPDPESGMKLAGMISKFCSRSMLVEDTKKLGENSSRLRKDARQAFGVDDEREKASSDYELLLRRAHALG